MCVLNAVRGMLGAAMCRVCLRAGPQLMALAQQLELPGEAVRTAGDLLMEVGWLQDLPGEFAKSLCTSCFNSLISAYLFKRKCHQADKIINSIITQIEHNLDLAKKIEPKTIIVLNVLPNSTNTNNEHEIKFSLSNYTSYRKSNNTFIFKNKRIVNHSCNGTLCSYVTDKNNRLCPDCGTYFKSARHILHGRKHECTECFKWFARKSSLIRHYKDIHLKIRNSYVCDLCGNLLANSYTLTEHLKLHNPKYCNGCEETFANAQTFNSHSCQTQKLWKRSATANMQPYRYCDHCDYKTKKKHTLGLHMNQRHFKTNAHECDICKKKFYQKSRLAEHKQTHDNLRPEKCDVCLRCFVNKKALLYHTRLHTGERPYQCKVCGKKFLCVSRERAHFKNSHTEKTVKCDRCESMFHTNSQVRSHFNKVHLKRKHTIETDLLPLMRLAATSFQSLKMESKA